MKKSAILMAAAFLTVSLSACTNGVQCEYPREQYQAWQSYDKCTTATDRTAVRTFNKTMEK